MCLYQFYIHSLAVSQSTTLVLKTKILKQLLDCLPQNSVQTFMDSWGRTLKTLAIHLRFPLVHQQDWFVATSEVSPAGRWTAQRRSWLHWRWGLCRPFWWKSSSCWSSCRLAGDTLWQTDLMTRMSKYGSIFKLLQPKLHVYKHAHTPTHTEHVINSSLKSNQLEAQSCAHNYLCGW